MSPKPPTPPLADLYANPCCACAGPHRLVDCDDPRGVDRLELAGLVMSADKVRQRVRAKGGAA